MDNIINSDMDMFLKLSTDKVRKNISIISHEEIGQNFLLHISQDKMNNKPYIPRIGHRQSMMEDRTVPRITVAPTLLGCYVGYAQLFNQFLNYNSEDKADYKQGLYIHEIEFDLALKPNSQLVYDSKRSDEHWLVTYNEDTKQYKGKIIGKMFIHEIKIKSASGKTNVCSASFYIEVNKPEGIRFSKNFFLDKGFWFVTGIDDADFMAWDRDKFVSVSEINKGKYDSAKEQSAAMLSLSVIQPPFVKW